MLENSMPTKSREKVEFEVIEVRCTGKTGDIMLATGQIMKEMAMENLGGSMASDMSVLICKTTNMDWVKSCLELVNMLRELSGRTNS